MENMNIKEIIINKDEDTYTILEVPQEFKEKVNEVMDKTYKDWKDIIRIK